MKKKIDNGKGKSKSARGASNGKQKPKKSSSTNNDKKDKEKGADSSIQRNAGSPAKPNAKTATRKRKPTPVKQAKKGKLTALQITRRYNKWFSDHVSKKTGRIKNYSYDVSNKILDVAYYEIQRGNPYPDINEIIAGLNDTDLSFTEITYQSSADSIKTLLRSKAYDNKKIKIINIFGREFGTKFNEVAVEICENNNTFFWMVIDLIRKKESVKSPVFLPFVTERKQNNNADKKTGRIPRVLKIDYSQDESVNGVNLKTWQKYKTQLKKQLKQ